MADRRADEAPIAPRRSLRAPSSSEGSQGSGGSSDGPVLPPMPRSLRRSRKERPAPAPSQSEDRQRPSRRTPPPSPTVRPSRPTRKARLRLVQVDPWSVTKTAFLLSIALGVVTVVAVLIVWTVLGSAGLWDSINSAVHDALGDSSGTPFDITKYVGTSRVLGFTMIVAVVDVVLITMIATLGAFLYNLAATLLGGIEVTLAEDD